MKKDDSQATSRRDFLKTGAVIGAGAALTTIVPAAAAAAPEDEQAPAEGKKKGYQLTQHVRAYYKTARL
jgi:hypothetical protein